MLQSSICSRRLASCHFSATAKRCPQRNGGRDNCAPAAAVRAAVRPRTGPCALRSRRGNGPNPTRAPAPGNGGCRPRARPAATPQQCAIRRRARSGVRAWRQVIRTRRQQRIRPFASVPAPTRPCVVTRVRHHPRTHRVPFDVAAAHQEVPGGIHQARRSARDLLVPRARNATALARMLRGHGVDAPLGVQVQQGVSSMSRVSVMRPARNSTWSRSVSWEYLIFMMPAPLAQPWGHGGPAPGFPACASPPAPKPYTRVPPSQPPTSITTKPMTLMIRAATPGAPMCCS